MLCRVFVLLLAGAPLVSGDVLLLASCPHEPEVVGVYTNNGKKCVRNRVETDRDIMIHGAECPQNMKYRNGKCRLPYGAASDEKAAVLPTCPEGYRLHGDSCRSLCPAGYQMTSARCILPQDSLSAHYMKCPAGHRRVDAFCIEYHAECGDIGAPGIFHYDDGKCERSREILPREVTVLKGEEECSTGKVMMKKGGRRFCQDPCPEFYKASIGKCELLKCVLRADRIHSQINCPEGSFQVPLAPM